MRTLPLLENRKSGGDKVEDFLGKGDYQPTGQGQEPLRTLGGIMALEGQTDLYDTPAQQNHTNGTNQGENECRKVVYHSERIVTGLSLIHILHATEYNEDIPDSKRISCFLTTTTRFHCCLSTT